MYPGVVNASVHLDPGDGTCSSAGGTNCTVTITSEGVYNVSLTLTNDVGPAQPVLDIFDCEWILCMYIHIFSYMHFQCYLTVQVAILICTCYNLFAVTVLKLDHGQEYCSPNATLTPGPGRFH